MNAQRTWKTWIARRDQMPRRLEETIRAAHTFKQEEIWTDVRLNEEIPDEKFEWSPPVGWREWKRPSIETLLPKPGTQAPDFKLASVDGGTIQLSDFRGNFVWLFKWRVGCPPCREEIGDLQQLYAKYKDKGLVVLGVNIADLKETVVEILARNRVEFPNIHDTSREAVIAVEKFSGGVASR